MKNNKLSIILLTILGILLALVVPFIINESYKVASGYVTNWGAADVLSYYGSLLGATATIIAVVLTIRFTKKQQRTERTISNRPFCVTSNKLINRQNEITTLEDGTTVFVFPVKQSFGSSFELPFSLKAEKHSYNQSDCVFEYNLRNIGGNSALNIDIRINGFHFLPPFGLGKGDTKRFVIQLPLKGNDSYSPYRIDIEYDDVDLSNKYIQTESFLIQKDGTGVTLAQKIEETMSSPQLIKEKQ